MNLLDIYIFGESSSNVINHYANHDYNANAYYTNDNEIKAAVDFINSPEMAAIGQIDNLNRLHHELCTKDWFMTLLDLKSYIQTKDKAFKLVISPVTVQFLNTITTFGN